MVIEDNDYIRENTAELLALNGYRVVTAANGQQGLDVLKNSKPAVILCDMLMPNGDGAAFLKGLKANAATSTIPLIFFSAGSPLAKTKNRLLLSADSYLSKPFTEEELLSAVGSVVLV